MSDIAILTAVSNRLIANLCDWEEHNCKPMIDGRPDPVANVHFAAVHISERQSRTTLDHGIQEELWSFAVTVSKRIEAIPYDRLNQSVYLTQLTGISPLMQRVVYQLHNRWKLVNEINALFPEDPELNVKQQRIIKPAVLLNRTPKVTLRDEEWWHGSHNQVPRDRLDGHVGLSMTAYFGNMIKETILVPEECP